MNLTRRAFIEHVGMGSAALLAMPSLIGCGDGSAGIANDLGYPSYTGLPVLGGDGAQPFWARGNYRPVADEIEAFDLEVIGTLPPELNGHFLRNGSNPRDGSSDHWFVGDGMLHGIHLEGGKALSYRNRWVQTAALQGNGGMTANRANTSLLQHHGRAMALYEVSTPYEFNVEDLSTVGQYDFGGSLTGPVTAHPKVDPVTGELFIIGYSPMGDYLTYSVLSPSGELMKSQAIDIPNPVMMHDFQLTENYAIFMDLPIVFDLSQLEAGFPFSWQPELGARLGVMPRYGSASEVEWFEIDPCFVFHTFNAFETETGQVILEGCRLESLNIQEFTSAENAPTPWAWTIDLSSKQTQEGPILDLGMDFPKIDPRRQGRRNRVNYGLHLVGSTDDYPAHATGLVKHDRDSGKTEIWHQGEAIQPDEALFVSAPNADGEDEGWLLSVVYNRATDKSEVIVIDAMSVEAGPIARVLLPRRVPFGFHGMWVPQASA